ncbi:MAG: hypothetical protein U1F42_07030 [Candidatus Competibacteraceae bacterium]
MGDAEHQKVEVRLAEPPRGTVQRQPPRAVADPNEAHQQPRQGGLVERESAKEALQALVVGLDLGLAAQASGQLGQADAAYLQQGQQEWGEETDSRPMPGQVFGQHRLQFLDRIVSRSIHQTEPDKCLSLAHENQFFKIFVLYLGSIYGLPRKIRAPMHHALQ